MPEKDYFINSIQMVDVHGGTNVPTVVYYRKDGSFAIGAEALSLLHDREDLNEEFKIDLGNQKPGQAAAVKKFRTGGGQSKSAGELTADFLSNLLSNVSDWLAAHDIAKGTSVLVAEPLAMQEDLVSPEWLVNYRGNLRRILLGKGFQNVEFLPEPFAVYQYYRYGAKHPIVADSRKHQALVVDFGGGTFDVCLIETTKEGDVWQAGRMAKPISASSNPIGGFFINRSIAEELVRKVLAHKNIASKIDKGIKFHKQWRREVIDLSSLASEYRSFIHHYHALAHRVEEAKIALCRLIGDWSLDSPLAISVPVAVPEDPFSEKSSAVNVQFSATQLRSLFVSKIWDQNLKHLIRLTMQRGRDELRGAPITVVLLSGGSANIRWLGELLRKEFGSEFADAEILPLPDFQEVVAKGLAVECVRRFHTGERHGDFAGVTYNRLCLILDPDETGYELKKFLPREANFPKVDIPGVLLPTASVLTRYRGKPMRWRVHMDTAPKRRLNYYFLRSSFDPSDIQNLHNVEEHTVHTPKHGKSDQDLLLELNVTEDGTATPKFIYKQGRTESDIVATEGRPFYLDMTTSDAGVSSAAYLGLDFGTSNTAVSFVDDTSIQVYQRRSQERSWNELSDLASSLPYPLASPLALYLCQIDPVKLVTAAREFLESSLTLAAYLAYLEYCTVKGRAETRLFKNFSKRSAGPLWNLFKSSMAQLGKAANLCKPYQVLLEPQLFSEIDNAVTLLSQHKHGKVSESSINILRPVQILANVSHGVFTESVFRVFQQVQKRRFGVTYEGLFRRTDGRPPFLLTMKYVGDSAFSNYESFAVNLEHKIALPLEPLIFWDACKAHPDLETGHCYIFDTDEGSGGFSYKAVGFSCTCVVRPDNEHSTLFDRLKQMTERDESVRTIAAALVS